MYEKKLVLINNYVNYLWNSLLVVILKMFLVGVHIRTHMNIRLTHVRIIWWLCFTGHGHGDVKLIMWAHVWHKAELIQHERWWFLITQLYAMSVDLRCRISNYCHRIRYMLSTFSNKRENKIRYSDVIELRIYRPTQWGIRIVLINKVCLASSLPWESIPDVVLVSNIPC